MKLALVALCAILTAALAVVLVTPVGRSDRPSTATTAVSRDTPEGCLYAVLERASMGAYDVATETTATDPHCDGLTDKQRLELARVLVSGTAALSSTSG